MFFFPFFGGGWREYKETYMRQCVKYSLRGRKVGGMLVRNNGYIFQACNMAYDNQPLELFFLHGRKVSSRMGMWASKTF